MGTETMSSKKINDIFEKVLNVVEESKSEIIDITEGIRKKYDDLIIQLENIKENVQRLIKEVDELEILEKQSQKKLLEVSKDFVKYEEKDIRFAYEQANILQVQLMLKRQYEQEMLNRRTEVEMRLKTTEKELKKAENLTSKIGVAHEFLGGNVQDISNALEKIEEKHLLGRKIISVQEEERKRVARDIHDGPAQALANLVIKSEVCEKLIDIDKKKAKKELRELKEVTRDSINDIRTIIYNLSPMSIDDLGFIPALQRYAENFQDDSNIEVDFIVLSEEDLTDRIKNISIFRIVQEVLNNVKKHSQATFVIIKIEIGKKNISIHIRDNGVGFDIENIQCPNISGGFGLNNIKERAELLNGNVEIISIINEGTTIKINIPKED